jgi:hypothetical protein
MATSTPGGDGASDTKRGMATSTPGGTSDTKISIAASTPGGDEGASDTKRSRLAALHRKHAAAVAATTTPSPSKQPPPSSSSPASFRIFSTAPTALSLNALLQFCSFDMDYLVIILAPWKIRNYVCRGLRFVFEVFFFFFFSLGWLLFLEILPKHCYDLEMIFLKD